jgi:hypothetical protein
VYHWMYTSHAVSSWGRTSSTKLFNTVAQRSTYGCTLSTQEKVPVTPLRDHLRRIKHICQHLKSSNAELNLKIYENSSMVCARNNMHHRHMLLLVGAELPQYPVDSVLLHIHVEQQWRPRHPVLLVVEAQSREALWCAGPR